MHLVCTLSILEMVVFFSTTESGLSAPKID